MFQYSNSGGRRPGRKNRLELGQSRDHLHGLYNTTQSEDADIRKTLDKFNASQEQIHVSLITVSRADYETKLNTMAAGKQLPDVCMMAEPMTIRYAAAGLLGGVVAIRGEGYTAVPYYTWANRGAGPMRVWLRE